MPDQSAFSRDHRLGETEQPGHVRVVAAGVHDVDLAAVGETLLRGRRVGQAGRLAHRIRIHVRAEPDRGSGAVREHADDPGRADAFGDGEAERLQILGDDRRSARLREGDLRVLMQVLEDGGEARGVCIDRRP